MNVCKLKIVSVSDVNEMSSMLKAYVEPMSTACYESSGKHQFPDSWDRVNVVSDTTAKENKKKKW